MKIAAIAGRDGRREIPSGSAGVEWIWVKGPEELQAVGDVDLYLDLDFVPEGARIGQLRQLRGPVMIDSVLYTLEEIGGTFVRVNGWPGMLERGIHELAVGDAATEAIVAGLYERLGWRYRIVPDVVGMISSRILAMIINEAYMTLQAEVSSREEIDAAMKLGTNYPYGPFEWSVRIGEERVYRLLEKLSDRDARYLPSEAFKAVVKD